MVPVASGAEETHHPAPGIAPDGAQDVFHAVRRVGTIDHDGKIPPGGDDLRPAADALRRLERLGAFLQRQPQRQAAADGRQPVVNGEHPGDIQPHPGNIIVPHQHRLHLIGQQADVFRNEIRLQPLGGIGEAGAGDALRQPQAPVVVQIQDGGVAPLKQQGLGLEIMLHVLMEIQMILRQIGKGRRRKVHAMDLLQHQTEGGDLHRGILAA